MTPPAELTSSRPGLSALQRLALVVNAGLAATWLIFWADQAVKGEFWRADFSMLYTGWSMVLGGDGHRLYDLNLQEQYQHRLIPQRAEEGGLLPFNYPPHAAVPAAALALLSRPAAYYLWSAIQLALLARVAYSLVQISADRDSRPLLLATLLAFPPVFLSFQLGQVSLLVLCCQVEVVRGLSRGRAAVPALWLVLGSIKPQLMLAPAIAVLAGRRWRVLGFACLFFVAWALLATAVLGWGCWAGWLRLLVYSAQQSGRYGIFPHAMYNLKALLTGLLGEERFLLVNALSLAALLLGLGWAAWLLRRGESDPAFAARLALAFWLLLLVNPHVNPSDVVTLALPAVLFLAHLRGHRGHAAFATLAVLGPALFALDRLSGVEWPYNVSPFRVVMLAVAVWMALDLRRRG